MPMEAAAEEELRRRVKAELRKRMRGLRNALPADACTKRSAKIIDGLRALAFVEQAQKIALFWPIEERHEVDLRPLDAALRAAKKRMYYPAIDPDTRVMTFREVVDVAALAEQGFGFAEPPPDAADAAETGLDLIVVPALAVDARGHRIGYGAGYYDRALARFDGAKAVAVIYDFQLVSEVPVTDGDVAVGWVVTDARSFAADP
jgi:5-formyltetrahydrofolate cyclo-ligase